MFWSLSLVQAESGASTQERKSLGPTANSLRSIDDSLSACSPQRNGRISARKVAPVSMSRDGNLRRAHTLRGEPIKC